MVCCVTGHRPKGFPFPRSKGELFFDLYRNALDSEIERLINEGCTHFISGMADGADLDFADAITLFRYEYDWIKLEGAIPYPLSKRKNPTDYTEERDELLLKCDYVHTVSTHYFNGCMQVRNKYMVDRSDIVLAIWNENKAGGTWNTIQYARSQGKEIRYIMLKELTDPDIVIKKSYDYSNLNLDDDDESVFLI